MGGNMSREAMLGIRTLDKTATIIGIKIDRVPFAFVHLNPSGVSITVWLPFAIVIRIHENLGSGVAITVGLPLEFFQ